MVGRSLRSVGLRVFCGAMLALGCLGQATAQPKPAGPVVLSITAPQVKADFDMATLSQLPQVSFTTATPWYGQPTKFTGPLLRDVLAAAGAKGTRLVAVALNDYKVEMPLEDATRHSAILALRMNDKPMSIRDKGPLFVVFNYDSASELRSERYYTRSIWQLRRLQVD